MPRTRAAPKFGLFIHLGTGTRCPHSACLARHTPVLTQRHATAGTSIRENSCRAHPRTTSCYHYLRHCGLMHLLEPSHSNANDCDFGATASFSPLPLDVHMHMHTLRMCRFPTLRTRSGSNTRTVAALAKLRSITGFKKSKIEPEARYLLCHCLARCLPSYCCTGPYWRILENTGRYCTGASEILRYSKARHTQV